MTCRCALDDKIKVEEARIEHPLQRLLKMAVMILRAKLQDRRGLRCSKGLIRQEPDGKSLRDAGSVELA